MILGIGLVLGSLLLSRDNRQEDISAKEAAEDVMPQLVQQIRIHAEETLPEDTALMELQLQKPVELLTEEDKKMTEVEIDGNLYIGYLSIPKLGLNLPIMGTWSYPQLNIAPCRYAGSVLGENLVLMAHNYSSHFGKISQLEPGDTVTFTDMNGILTQYQVVGEDILAPNAVEEMTSGDFDLTLFTCTYGGKNRVVVYCDLDA